MDPAFWFGLAIFLVPAALFGWAVLSRRGREAHERAVEEAQRDFEGRPLPPPSTAVSRWALAHPWMTVVGAGVSAAALIHLLGVAAFGQPAEEAARGSATVGIEAMIVAALHVVRERRRRPPR